MKHEKLGDGLYQSSDYGAFKFLSRNRAIFEPHVRKIIQSLEQNGYFKDCPILVNKHYEIIDGQHRIMACERLMIPVLFRVSEEATENDIARMNMHKTWELEDRVKHHYNKEDYKILEEFNERSGFGYSLSAAMIGNYDRNKQKTTTQQRVRSGTFQVDSPSLEKAERLLECIKELRVANISLASSSKFAAGLRIVSSAKGFSYDVFVTQLQKQVFDKSRFRQQVSINNYAYMLEEIYNYHMGNKGWISINMRAK